MEDYWIIQDDSEQFTKLAGCKDKILCMNAEQRSNLDGKRIFHFGMSGIISYVEISVNEKGRLRYSVPAKA